jgi:deoxycytidine triphosphate deaminase
MSVLQIKGRTTKSHTDFDAASYSSNSLILTNARDDRIEEFSLELSVGEGWSDNYSGNDKNLWRIVDGMTIKGHDSVVVEAAEEIKVPHNRYGIVLPTGSLFLSRGVLVASAKVEPAFDGKLKLRIFNTTNKNVQLTKGEKLGSVIFFSTESTHTQNPIKRGSEISTLPITRRARLKKWFSLNPTIWIGWTLNLIGSSLVSSLILYWNTNRSLLKHNKALSHRRMKLSPNDCH